MWNTSVPKGKIPYIPTWQLVCKLSPVITLGKNILPGSRLHEFDTELKTFQDLEMTLQYDQQILYQSGFPTADPVTIKHQLNDDKENIEHLLCIGLLGKTDDHSCFYQGSSMSLGVQIDLFIEDLPMNMHLMISGLKTVMGENETQTLVLQTPIYRWLYKNQEHIMTDLQSIYKE